MTVKEALLAEISVEASDSQLIKALADVQATEDVLITDIYESSEHRNLVDLAAINVLQSLLSLPDFTEGGVSMKYDKKYMQARLIQLQVRQGVYVEEGTATVSDISNLW